MKAYRAALLRFADDGSALYEADGLLVVGGVYDLESGLVELTVNVPKDLPQPGAAAH